MNSPPVDRPNTVAGLVEKRAELAGYRKHLENELHKVTCDLDHLEAAIRLFDPEADIRRVKRYATKHRAKKGHMRRFVLERLKEAVEPITSRQIAEAWVQDRGLNADDATLVIIRKRVGACLNSLKLAGVIVGTAQDGPHKGWRSSRT